MFTVIFCYNSIAVNTCNKNTYLLPPEMYNDTKLNKQSPVDKDLKGINYLHFIHFLFLLVTIYKQLKIKARHFRI